MFYNGTRRTTVETRKQGTIRETMLLVFFKYYLNLGDNKERTNKNLKSIRNQTTAKLEKVVTPKKNCRTSDYEN